MNNQDLSLKQEELDRKKYQSSLTVRCDMSGKMEYCKECLFRNDKHECEIPHEIRKDYNVCARQYFKLQEEVENDKLTIQPRKTRKRSNG